MSSPEHRKAMDEAFDKVKELGSQLGDEIVIALAQDGNGTVRGPILMAEVKDRSTFRHTLSKDMKDVKGANADVHVKASMKFEGPVVRIEFAGFEPASVRAARSVTAAAPVAWDSSPFRDKLAAAYADGTSWLFGVDLKAMVAQAAEKARASGDRGEAVAAQWDRMGVLDAQYLILERTEGADSATIQAEVSFDQPRRGIAGGSRPPPPWVRPSSSPPMRRSPPPRS